MKKSEMVRGMLFGAEHLTEVFKEVVKLGGTEEDMFRGMKTGSGLAEETAKLIVGRRNAKIRSEFLTPISSDEEIVIDAVDGTEILAKATDTFSYIDSDFVVYGADEPGTATGETPVRVHEMVKNATFTQMFGSLSPDLGKLCLTQAQIKNFVKKHRNRLRTGGCATAFFLFKSRKNFFVASVYVGSGGALEVSVYRFEYLNVWNAVDRRRVVTPQLAV